MLKDILSQLYYPKCPYEFSILPVEILGNAYEQFLGKVIRLTAGHHAKIEEKPEVRKAGGVYYTPQYIVDYIVKNTVGKLCENKTPADVRELRILDPACGSGSFLLGAYQFLMDWHLAYYKSEHEKTGKIPLVLPEKGKRRRKSDPYVIFQGRGGDWYLTTAEKKRILTNNIYGVDIDANAVEVTKLSLLLKVLEDENSETLSRQLGLWRERALPDLGGNIKCGNSLIGSDFYDNQQAALFDEAEMLRINVFDWDREFPGIFARGGFDAVIGNPPYLRIQGLQKHYSNQIVYYSKKYQSAVKRFDLYLLFIEKGFSLFNEQGYLGFICPHKFINSDFGSGIRKFLIDNSSLNLLISFGNNLIFNQASTYTGLLFLQKKQKEFFYYEFPNQPQSELQMHLNKLNKNDLTNYPTSGFSDVPWVFTDRNTQIVLRKLKMQRYKLGDVFDEIMVGIQSGIDNIHVLKKISKPQHDIIKVYSEREGREIEIEIGLLKPILRGEDVHRYEKPVSKYYCIYPYYLENEKTKIMLEEDILHKFPLGYNYLKRHKTELKEIRTRQKTNPIYWYSCHRSKSMSIFEKTRIITPEISLGCNMTMGDAGIYHNTKVYSLMPSKEINENILYWLGILNSKILWWYIKNTGYVLRGGYYKFKTNYLMPFPIHFIDFSIKNEFEKYNKVVLLVEQILDFHKKLTDGRDPRMREQLQRRIDSTDNQIDRLVYDLYGLTDKEIGLWRRG